MIRINLAQAISRANVTGGPSAPVPTELDANARKQAIMKILLCLAGPVGLFGYQQVTLPEMETSLAKNQSQLSELQNYNAQKAKSVAEIKKFKEEQAKIQARISSLDKITKNRFRDIKVLDLIQQVIPEKVWLTKVESAKGKMTLSGNALSDFEVSTFMEFLAKSVYFLDVNLVSSTEVAVDGTPMKHFEIACTMEKRATK